MEVKRAALLIADIGGYTRFMLASRASLAHAQVAVSSLLEAVLDGAKHVELQKLEGDAAFFAGPVDARLGDDVARMRAGFLARRAALVAERMCDCNGCTNLENLTLKFVAHVGEVAVHRIRNLQELAGVDVILVHRMLKNDVPVPEYVLVTDAALQTFGDELRAAASRIEHEFDGIGATVTHWLEAGAFAAPPPARPMSLWEKLARKVVHEARSLPYYAGLRRPMAMTLDDEEPGAPRG